MELKDKLVGEAGFRPGFLGHIIVELLLDSFLHETNPGKLDQFYALISDCDPSEIQKAVNKMASRPTEKLEGFFTIFVNERYLFDYVDDDRLMYRINQVLRRVRLRPVSNIITDWVRSARSRVYDLAPDLLGDYARGVA